MEVYINSPLKVDDLLASTHSNKKARMHHSSYSESQVTSKVKNPFAAALHVEKTPFLIMQLNSAFNAIPSDNRELWVNLGHAAKTLDEDGGDEGKQAWLEWSTKSGKFDPDDAERKCGEASTPTSHVAQKNLLDCGEARLGRPNRKCSHRVLLE